MLVSTSSIESLMLKIEQLKLDHSALKIDLLEIKHSFKEGRINFNEMVKLINDSYNINFTNNEQTILKQILWVNDSRPTVLFKDYLKLMDIKDSVFNYSF